MRVAELLGSLSLATDLADGFSLEKCLRTAVVATRLARAFSGDLELHRTTYWSSVLRFVGCTGFAHEEGRDYAAGDDLSLRKTLAFVDFGRPEIFVERAQRDIAPSAAPTARAAALKRLLTREAPVYHAQAQCEVGAGVANAIGMPDVAAVLALRDERHDGKGPRGLAAADQLPLALRISDVADTAELFAWTHGIEEALAELQRRRGGHLDPALVDLFVAHAPELFGDLGTTTSIWDTFLELEPSPHRTIAGDKDALQVLRAFSRVADISSIYTLGHSTRVAELAARAAEVMGLGAEERALAEKAGYVHDLGRVAIPNGIWEKPGPLSAFERERMRTHSQQTETILRLAPSFRELAEVAGSTHERGLGAGYHRRLELERVPPIARILAAVDVYVALDSDRPQRPRFDRNAIEKEMRAEHEQGALDGRAVRAVLDAAGHPPASRAKLPRGLTEREVEVVRLVAIGRTNKEIGELLGISDRTAQKHVMNVYQKLGLESRAGLALFAMENDLL